MSEPTGRGSIIYKLIAAALIVVVICAIIYPQKEWERQKMEQEACRLHMENVYYTSLQYLKKFKTFNSNLDSLLYFIENDSMLAPPGMFEVERLTIWESPRDSFLVGFPDNYHYDKMEWEYINSDSLLINLTPKERFKLNPESKLIFHSEDSLFIKYRGKGEKDKNIYVWGKTRVNYERVFADSVMLPTKMFAISEDPKDFGVCPTCGAPYKISTNVRVKLKGEIHYTVQRDAGGNVQGNDFLKSLFVKKLRKDAASLAIAKMNADTSFYNRNQNLATKLVLGEIPPDTVEISDTDSSAIATARDSLLKIIRDSMTVNNFTRDFSALKTNSKVLIDEEASRTFVFDSLAAWEDSIRIKNLLFAPKMSEEEEKLAARDDIAEIFGKLTAVEKYYIAGVDTVGLTIECPIDSVINEPEKSFLMKIFGVGKAENHGKIKNGDYSWSEKK